MVSVCSYFEFLKDKCFSVCKERYQYFHFFLQFISLFVFLTIPHLVRSVGRAPVCRAEGSGRTNHGLKITGKIRYAVLNTLPQFRRSHRWLVNFNDGLFSCSPSYSLDREPTSLFENALEDAVSSVVAWPLNIHSWVG